ncbi:OmpW family protein [Ochrobactrum sp. MR28]|nr:OmpW family protein [Ochrobactrum sp. MR28]MBX8816917.1 OmpW family protein [Ochrobactrum sp. MR31]
MALFSANRHTCALLAATALTALAVQPVLAADAIIAPVEPQITENLPVVLSPWQVRVRALGVVPENRGYVNEVPGSGIKASNTVVPELDISYYFTNNIAAELILGTTYSNITGKGAIDGLDVGKTWLLPPTLTLQYHFTDFGAFKPYIGAGVNYTFFYNQKNHDADYLKVKNTFGGALQVGFDYMIDDHWGFNFDVKKLYLRPNFDVTVGGAEMSGKAKLDPWLIGTGITYRF